MKTNEEIWRNCANNELKEMLDLCSEIIEKIKGHLSASTTEWVDIYELLLSAYNIEWGFEFISEKRVRRPFTYWYRIDDEVIDMAGFECFKTKAEAQLRAVHETMYKLKNRMLAKTSNLINKFEKE